MVTIDWKEARQRTDVWLGGLGIALAGLHLLLLDKAKEEHLFSISLLMWLTVASLLWDRRRELSFKSDTFSTVFGAVLLLSILARNLIPTDLSLRLLPLVGGISLALLASGYRNLRQYWREITALTLLLLAKLITTFLNAINLPLFTAKVATFLLWLGGFEVYREGVYIELSKGKVEVLGACSGVESILLVVCVAVLFFFLIPVSHVQKIICLLIAALIGFVVNAVRVIIMALLVDIGDKPGFDYWHGSDGSLSFAVVSVCLFGLYCWLAYVRNYNGSSPSQS
ncbi:MAG: cyanoexosortase A [Cyanobacteriota bacterium]|nr:cyanoexosortase A [Cyanobacteriota bacterium]